MKMSDVKDMTLLESIVSILFVGEEECILGDKFSIDSAILISGSGGNYIKMWLGEVNIVPWVLRY